MRKLALAILLLATPAMGATRYASSSGSGSTCSSGSPCATDVCVSGMADNDSCLLQPGTYSNPPTMATGRSCTTRCYIRAETEAECNARGGSSCSAGVTINKTSGDAVSLSSGENNWTIQGLVVNQGGAGKGYVADGVSGLRLTDLSYYPAYNVVAGEGIYVTASSDVIVTNYTARHDTVCSNEVTAACLGGGFYDCDFWNDGGALINIGAGSSDVIWQDSHVGYYRNVGIFRNITNLTIRRNYWTQCVNHGCAEIDDAVNVLIENNVHNMDESGGCSDAYHGGDVIDTYCWKDVTIRNNTFVFHGRGPFLAIQHFFATRTECNDGVGPENMDAAGSAQYMNEAVYNNIIYDAGTDGVTGHPSPFTALFLMQEAKFDTSPSGQYYEDYNVLYPKSSDKVGIPSDSGSVKTYAQWDAYTFDTLTPEDHGKNTEPTFNTYSTDGGLFGANDNLRLKAGSNAIDAGVNSGSYLCPSDDITGAARTGTCDIGAYNYTTGGGSLRRRTHVTSSK